MCLHVDHVAGQSVVSHVAGQFALFVYSFLPDLGLEAWVLESGTLNSRSSRQTRAKWSLPPHVQHVFPLAGHTFLGWPPRRSPHKKYVPGSLRSFIWLCLRPVQWTSSSVPCDESTINLFVCLAHSMALASITTSCRVFSELSGFYMCFEELSSCVILIEAKNKFVSSEFISELTVIVPR